MKLLILMTVFLSLSGHAQEQFFLDEEWKGFSDPDIMSSGFTHKLSDLPLNGSIDINPRGWSGDYWSAKKGGINYRWNASTRIGYDLNSPSKSQVQNMSLDELSSLAPSEKLDLLMGRYDYPFVKEVSGTASKLASDWAGICHGWAPATLYHNEPMPKTLVNADGIQIPFGSGDIKALISYYYAFHNDDGDVNQMGLRCFFGRWLGAARGCQEDLNAGAFHIVLANKIGLQKEGFIMDIERWREVWNHPAIAYRSAILATLPVSKNAAKTAVKELRIKTIVLHSDGSKPTWGTVFGTAEQKTAEQEYTYRIEINNEGKIVGGTWESSNRPDFIWNVSPVTEFNGLLSGLPALLND